MEHRHNYEEIIRRIVQVAQPERIILFGSVARGEMSPHSDVDLLVIKSGEFDDLSHHQPDVLSKVELPYDLPGHRARAD